MAAAGTLGACDGLEARAASLRSGVALDFGGDLDVASPREVVQHVATTGAARADELRRALQGERRVQLLARLVARGGAGGGGGSHGQCHRLRRRRLGSGRL